MIRFCDLTNRFHVRGLAKQMDGNNTLGSRRDSRFELGGIQVVGDGINVHKNRFGTESPNGACGGKEGEARNNHLVAWLDV